MTPPSEAVKISAKFISTHSSTVHVDENACVKAAVFLRKQFSKSSRTVHSISASWCGSNGLHPPQPSPAALAWIFLVDTLNFCFWTRKDSLPYTVQYKGKSYTGYWALCAAVNRALDEGISLTNAHVLSTIDLETVSHIFRSSTDTPVPLLEERHAALKESGSVLLKHFRGSVQVLVDASNGSAQNLVQLVVEHFPSFNDSVPSDSFVSNMQKSEQEPPSRLYFYKRAQILVADIWACFAASPQYSFYDIEELTMFADYRVPQILAWLGTIKYSTQLLEDLNSDVTIPSGDFREVSIRGCSIQAVELIRDNLKDLDKEENDQSSGRVDLNSILIDYTLWDYAKEHEEELANVPIHRVLSPYY